MKLFTQICGIFLALAFTFLPDKQHWFLDQSRVVLLSCWFIFSLLVSFRYAGTYFVLFGMLATGYSAIQVFASPFTHFGDNSALIDGPAAQCLLWFSLLIGIVTFSPRFVLDAIHESYEWAAFISAFLLILGKYGSVGVYSVDSAFIAMVLPSLLLRREKINPKSGLCLIAVAFSMYGATGIFALLGGIIAYDIFTSHKRLVWIAPAFALVVGLGYTFQGQTLVNGSGRMLCWTTVLDWWKHNANLWQGMGLGTFQIVGVGIQAQAGMKESFMYMHNEYLQILFEQGYVGLALALLVFARALVHSFKLKRWSFVSLAPIAIVALTQSPFRISFLALYVSLIVREALILEAPSVKLPNTDWKEQNRLLRYVYDAE